MRRAIPAVSVLAFVFLSVSGAPARAQSAPASAADKAHRDKEKDQDKSKEKKPPKVYTNDDLEETSTRPSKVQDATAQGAEPYAPPPEVSAPDTSSEAPPAGEQMSEREMRLKEAEDNVKGLEQSANALLWQYLQSSDSNEILRLKAEQQGVLEQLEQAKAELARLKAEEDSRPRSTQPTPPPG